MKTLFTAFVCMIAMSVSAQTNFKKGYFIDSTNKKVECYIKSEDWKNNPSDFKYKNSEQGEERVASIKEVQEFGVYNEVKFVRSEVSIDMSRSNLTLLDNDRNPKFERHEVFLKVLVEGSASLYYYEKSELVRYFYLKEGNENIKQLIFKSYLVDGNKLKYNNLFRQQLLDDVKCSEITLNRIKRLEYKRKDLVDYFVSYNECSNVDYVNFELKPKSKLLHVSVRPGMKYSSFSFENTRTGYKHEFDNELSFRLGVELEIILPFNNNKWAILAEPTLQSYKTESVVGESNSTLVTNYKIDYQAIEVPMGLRHYFFLNEKSKIFIDAQVEINLTGDSKIKRDEHELHNLKVNSPFNVAFGVGYKYNDRYSIQARYMTPRDFLREYNYWISDYTAFSLVLGYKIF